MKCTLAHARAYHAFISRAIILAKILWLTVQEVLRLTVNRKGPVRGYLPLRTGGFIRKSNRACDEKKRRSVGDEREGER